MAYKPLNGGNNATGIAAEMADIEARIVELQQQQRDLAAERSKMSKDAFKEELKILAQRKDQARNDQKEAKLVAKRETELNKAKTEAERKRIEAEYKLKIDNLNKEHKLRMKLDEAAIKAEARLKEQEDNRKRGQALTSALTEKGLTLSERANKLGQAINSDSGPIGGALSALSSALSNFATQLNGDIEKIAGTRSTVDTALQGSSRGKSKGGLLQSGSYWDAMSKDIKNAVGASPYVKQQEVVNNVTKMVSAGISDNVEQRAFLETIKDKIAATFDANNGTLLRLIRIQEKDSTASRLGMESAMTTFLNNMYENSEYIASKMSTTVKGNLEEAMSLMTAESSVNFEYNVQKWMGSLYSKGFSNTSSLSSALGQLASGDINSLTSSATGNLLLMAANKSNLSLSEMLANGLTGSSANSLMEAMVSYMGDLYSQAGGNKLMLTQLANVYGLKASDLLAASKLRNKSAAISNNNLTYAGGLSQLANMAATLSDRTSIGEKLETSMANLQYSMAAGIASSPALYSTYKIANMLSDVAGGINFSIPMVMGNGTAQTFNVADLMRAGAMGGSILGNMGSLFSSLGIGGNAGLNLLNAFGISASGNRRGLSTGTSESGYFGNSNGGDVSGSVMGNTIQDQNETTAQAKNESEDVTISTVDTHVVQIYNLLSNVIDNDHIRVSLLGGFIS